MRLDSSSFDFQESPAADSEGSTTSGAPEPSAESLPPMLVTHPPSRSLAAWQRRNTIVNDRAEEDSRAGVRFDTLFKAATADMGVVKRIFSARGVEFAGASQWRVLPESALDRVTGWEMLAVLNKTDPNDTTEEIERIMDALKKWDHVANAKSEGGDEQNEAFAWELEDMEQDSPFEKVTVGSGPW